jgi:PleD family two-component response regulator
MNDRVARPGLPLALLAGGREDSTHWLRSLLESGGYAVLRERSGSNALERARSTEPDVIVVDAALPDMSGIELCRALSADPRISISTPIILSILEPASRAQRLAALRAGAWECLAPPHDAEEIVLKIDAFVRAKLDADRARAEGLLDPATRLYNLQGLVRRARELGSQAFRQHGPLACVVLAVDVEPTDPAASPVPAETPNWASRWVHALTSAARRSDVVGRLSPSEFAVLAPGTDATGARRLAERLAGSIQTDTRAVPATPPRIRGGYEAVANVGYAPIEPVDLLIRASAALRTGKAEAGAAGWLRRFEGAAPTEPPSEFR